MVSMGREVLALAAAVPGIDTVMVELGNRKKDDEEDDDAGRAAGRIRWFGQRALFTSGISTVLLSL